MRGREHFAVAIHLPVKTDKGWCTATAKVTPLRFVEKMEMGRSKGDAAILEECNGLIA